MQNLLNYFTKGTEGTVSGATWGAEIETHFVTKFGHEQSPISQRTARRILSATPTGPWQLKPELGCQLLELAVDPQSSPDELLRVTREGLEWLYAVARSYGAVPCFFPTLHWLSNLLLEPEGTADGRRDALFMQLDGRPALEELCRIAAVQFTISVAPKDAIGWINRLWEMELQRLDYPNHVYWQRYIQMATASYDPLRYGGPAQFVSLEDYAQKLAKHSVVMNDSGICRLPVTTLGNDHTAINMFLRSVWWHFRLRRYGNALALEIRPQARRDDNSIADCLHTIRHVLSI